MTTEEATRSQNQRMRGHKLMTKELERQLPGLLKTDGQGEEAIVRIKYFTPDSSFTWYGLEYDPNERIFFGWVINDAAPQFAELGMFSLDELELTRGPWGLPVERDLYFDSQPLRAVKARHLGPGN